MSRLILLIASLALLATAQAAEVFKTKDAQGNIIYTDRPESLPAQKVNVATRGGEQQADDRTPASAPAAQAKADPEQQAAEARQAKELTAADKAKRCVDARARYDEVLTARRLYEPGEKEGERRYLDSKEIDETRAAAKQAMDEFCADQ